MTFQVKKKNKRGSARWLSPLALILALALVAAACGSDDDPVASTDTEAPERAANSSGLMSGVFRRVSGGRGRFPGALK